MFYSTFTFAYGLPSCTKEGEEVSSSKPCCGTLSDARRYTPCQSDDCLQSTIRYCTNTDDSPQSCGTFCQSDNECSSGQGCRPQQWSDAFDPSLCPASRQASIEAEMVKAREVNTITGPKENGIKCYKNAECKSYFCDVPNTGKCMEKKICRFARFGERIVGVQKCISPYVPTKQSDGTFKCNYSPEDLQDVYLGLSGDIGIAKVGEGECKETISITTYNDEGDKNPTPTIDPKIIERILRFDLKNLRVMEWLFSTSKFDHADNASFTENKDCLGLSTFLNKTVRKELEERKAFLKTFNEGIKRVENEQKILESIMNETYDGNAEDIITINLDDEPTPFAALDLKSNQAMAFKLNKEKIRIFKKYEESLIGHYEKYRPIFEYIITKMADFKELTKGWGHDSKAWSFEYKDGAEVNYDRKGIGCPWTFSDDLKNSWMFSYELELSPSKSINPVYYLKNKLHTLSYIAAISGAPPMLSLYLGTDAASSWFAENTAIKTSVDLYHTQFKDMDLKTIANEDDPLNLSHIDSEFNPDSDGFVNEIKNYWLIDPLLPGDIWSKEGASDDSSLWMWGTTYRRWTPESRNSSKTFEHYYTTFKAKIQEYFKTNSDVGIFESELIPLSLNECLTNPNLPKDQVDCTGYQEFIDELTGIAVAQYWAYSTHRKNTYEEFHTLATNFRRRLLKSYEVSMLNLGEIYKASSIIRGNQMNCMDLIIKKIEEGGTGEGGVVVGGGTAGAGAGTGNGGGIGSGGYDLKSKTIDEMSLATGEIPSFKFNINPNLAIPSGFGRSNVSSLSSSSFTGGNVNSSGSVNSASASRRKQMREANKRAIQAGTKFAARNKASKSAISKIGSNSYLKSLKNGGASNLGLNNANATNSARGKAGLNLTSDSSSNIESNSKKDKDLKSNSNNLANGNTNSKKETALENQPEKLNLTDDAQLVGHDKTGLDANDVISGVPDRNSKELKPTESDSLFQVLSKAYLRSLERVLIRRKKGDAPPLKQ